MTLSRNREGAVAEEREHKHRIKIPDTDILGKPFPFLKINHERFDPGRSYEVDLESWNTLTDRIDRVNKERIRMSGNLVDEKVTRRLAALSSAALESSTR